MKSKLTHLVALALIVGLALCSQGQSVRRWTAVGDDGAAGGPAVGYVLAWSLDSLDVVTADRGIDGWDLAAPDVSFVGSENLPQYLTPGTQATATLPWDWFPTDTVIYVSIKAYDDAIDVVTGNPDPNWGELGNILRVRTPDRIAPAAIWDLQ